jgi:hypothetical protein
MPAHESSADSNGHQGPERPLGDHLAHVVTLYRKWFFLADPGHLLVVLGCIVANLLPGDPVWLMLVAVASAGKTEMLQACKGLPHVFSAATLTEGSLLSRTAQKERTPGAPGGLLRAVGEFGIVLLMDFGSLPSMNRDTGPIQFAVMQS